MQENTPTAITHEEWEAALAARHGADYARKLADAHVAVAGLGGWGWVVAVALARAGGGHLPLIDCDAVELCNLHRQQYELAEVGQLKTAATAARLRRINLIINIKTTCQRVEAADIATLFAGERYVAECFDAPAAKAMLVNGLLSSRSDCYVVAASGMAGLEDGNMIRTRRVGAHFYLCGDGVTGIGEGVSLFAARVGICAMHQALKIIELITTT